MSHNQSSEHENYWRSKSGLAVCAFLGLAGVILILEHRARVLEWLPYLLLLACPLMHFFMHGKHGGHSGQVTGSSSTEREGPGQSEEPKR